MSIYKEKKTSEFGDFQTPRSFANELVGLVVESGYIDPQTIIDPTCGKGNFLKASINQFPNLTRLIGVDINGQYIKEAKLALLNNDLRCDFYEEDFFSAKWDEILKTSGRLLVIGNPPWVTNSAMPTLKGSNLPFKSNFKKHNGLDAITGKSNFDISEWMILLNLQWIDRFDGCLAVICKYSVARKVLRKVFEAKAEKMGCRIYKIDAAKVFGVAVDACFLMVGKSELYEENVCQERDGIHCGPPDRKITYIDKTLVSDADKYNCVKDLAGVNKEYVWRSGIKHDCSKVMELRNQNGAVYNGFGELVEIEREFLYPLLKSSDLNKTNNVNARLQVIVPQLKIGEETASLALRAPRTWSYLNRYGHLLDRRASSIYRKSPRFGVFGLGSYSFSMWKVAISGFYKRIYFQVIGPINGRPVMLDDTGYFIPCDSGEEAELLVELLSASPATMFYESLVYWSDKRPITIDLLQRLDLRKLATRLGRSDLYAAHCDRKHGLPLFT